MTGWAGKALVCCVYHHYHQHPPCILRVQRRVDSSALRLLRSYVLMCQTGWLPMCAVAWGGAIT